MPMMGPWDDVPTRCPISRPAHAPTSTNRNRKTSTKSMVLPVYSVVGLRGHWQGDHVAWYDRPSHVRITRPTRLQVIRISRRVVRILPTWSVVSHAELSRDVVRS